MDASFACFHVRFFMRLRQQARASPHLGMTTQSYVLTRLRPASMRKKMKSSMVKPHSDEPP